MKIKFLAAQMALIVSASWVVTVFAQDEFTPAPPQDIQQMPQQMPEQMPQQMPQQMPEQAPQQMPEQMPQQMPEQAPQQMPEQMSQQMPVDHSDDEDSRPRVKTKMPAKPVAPIKKVIIDEGGSLKLVPSK